MGIGCVCVCVVCEWALRDNQQHAHAFLCGKMTGPIKLPYPEMLERPSSPKENQTNQISQIFRDTRRRAI